MATACPSPSTAVALLSDPPRVYDETCARAVRCVARSLLGRHGIREQDLEDVEQDLALALLQRLPAFDPTRASWRTFVERCVTKSAISLIRYRRAKCRRLATGGNGVVPPGDGLSGAQQPAPDDHDDDGCAGSLVGGDDLPDPHGSGVAQIALQLDLAEAMERLTPFQQAVCRCLREYEKVEVHDLLGVKRWRVSQALVAIRQVFTDVGLSPAA